MQVYRSPILSYSDWSVTVYLVLPSIAGSFKCDLVITLLPSQIALPALLSTTAYWDEWCSTCGYGHSLRVCKSQASSCKSLIWQAPLLKPDWCNTGPKKLGSTSQTRPTKAWLFPFLNRISYGLCCLSLDLWLEHSRRNYTSSYFLATRHEDPLVWSPTTGMQGHEPSMQARSLCGSVLNVHLIWGFTSACCIKTSSCISVPCPGLW